MVDVLRVIQGLGLRAWVDGRGKAEMKEPVGGASGHYGFISPWGLMFPS